MPASAFAPNPLMSVLHGFATAQVRMIEHTEREVHRGDELPVGEGWVRTEYDPVIQYAVWERTRLVRAAS